MIFVTVGTHEQSFNRLIQKVDNLVRDGEINEKIFMQIGYTSYKPKYAEWKRFIDYSDMNKYMNESSTIITHGGPSTYMQAIQQRKKPIVVPRKEMFGEHVNDHQLWVSKQVLDKGYPMFLCENIEELSNIILLSKKSDNILNIKTHNSEFIESFSSEISHLLNRKSEK